ncbi:hypothetical protein DUI87_20352 [Hirundo rustica rustica]|uniref:MARVEL domain-containing protein n=1 Tax=Hirundo rustica rustica TaxID=333673 RepID=A0A3M0JQ52_HIRRU|nr:hypothetical protein DUI87_20352 [Hirundo rustica rustica]
MDGGAFGAGKAGGAFDPQAFVRQPQTILRFVSWVFSIVVFGSIVNEGYVNRANELEEHCIFNRNHNACNYGITVGVLAFLSCLLYLALDAYFPQISSVKDRKKAVLSDIGVSAPVEGIALCLSLQDRIVKQWLVHRAQVGQAFLAYQRFQLGADSALFSQDYMDPSQDSSMPYAPYTNEEDATDVVGTYQQPPQADAFNTETQGYQTQSY